MSIPHLKNDYIITTMKKLLAILIILTIWGLVFRPPVEGGTISSWYGIRILNDRSFHTGTDIALPIGSPVNPPIHGTVAETGYNERNGNYIIITHLPRTDTRYLHLHSIGVRTGEKVDARSVIGTVGNTGISTGSHLHYEIRVFNVSLPPYFISFPGRLLQKTGIYGIIDNIIGFFKG